MIAPGITLYLLRHGQTEWNTQHRLQGCNHDSPLTDLGRKQAKLMASILAREIGSAHELQFISSPAKRARTTLGLILEELGVESDHASEERIREIDLGEWSGLTIEQVQTRFPENWKARSGDRWNVPPIGGENYLTVAERAKSWLAKLSCDTVAVSHGGFGRVLRGIYSGVDHSQIHALDEPQDCVFRLRDGNITRLESLER